MSIFHEIKTAIAHLDPREKAILTAELFAMEFDPDKRELEGALNRGLRDVEAGRVRSTEEVRAMIPRYRYRMAVRLR